MSESEPKPGEFRVARSKRTLPRLVLILCPFRNEEIEPASLAALVTNEVEYATHRDVRVGPEQTGLQYEVLIETDFFAPIWDDQFDEPIGHLAPELNWLLRPRPRPAELPVAIAAMCGLPLVGPWDPRWAWKARELEHMHRLAAACYFELTRW